MHFGSVSEKVIDEAALRIVRTLLAHEEKIRQYGKIDAERQLWDDRQLAKKSALAGITLLRNQNGILPLSGRCHKIVVIGRLADEDVTGDRGSSQVYPALSGDDPAGRSRTGRAGSDLLQGRKSFPL